MKHNVTVFSEEDAFLSDYTRGVVRCVIEHEGRRLELSVSRSQENENLGVGQCFKMLGSQIEELGIQEMLDKRAKPKKGMKE
jgi:hypothetical protein